MKETIEKITSSTSIGVGLVITLIAAAVSFGVMFNQVQELKVDVNELKIEIRGIRTEISAVKNLLIDNRLAYEGT